MYSHIHSVQSLSHGQLFVTPWTAACQVSLCFTNSQLPELVQTHVHWVGDAFQPSHPLSSPSPLAINLSLYQGLFQWVGSSHLVTKYWSFSFSSSLSSEYSKGLFPLGLTSPYLDHSFFLSKFCKTHHRYSNLSQKATNLTSFTVPQRFCFAFLSDGIWEKYHFSLLLHNLELHYPVLPA